MSLDSDRRARLAAELALMSAGVRSTTVLTCPAFRPQASLQSYRKRRRARCAAARPSSGMPEGSFKDVGTYVNTILVTVDAPEAAKQKEAA